VSFRASIAVSKCRFKRSHVCSGSLTWITGINNAVGIEARHIDARSMILHAKRSLGICIFHVFVLHVCGISSVHTCMHSCMHGISLMQMHSFVDQTKRKDLRDIFAASCIRR